MEILKTSAHSTTSRIISSHAPSVQMRRMTSSEKCRVRLSPTHLPCRFTKSYTRSQANWWRTMPTVVGTPRVHKPLRHGAKVSPNRLSGLTWETRWLAMFPTASKGTCRLRQSRSLDINRQLFLPNHLRTFQPNRTNINLPPFKTIKVKSPM